MEHLAQERVGVSMWFIRSIAIALAPIMALVPAHAAAQEPPESTIRGAAKKKAAGTGPKPNGPVLRSVRASARILQGVKLRMKNGKPSAASKRRFQINLAPNGRKLIEFE